MPLAPSSGAAGRGKAVVPAPSAVRGRAAPAAAVPQRNGGAGQLAVAGSAPSAKARGIQEDMDNLNDEYFGRPPPAPMNPSTQHASAVLGGDGVRPQLQREARTVRMPLSPSWAVGPSDPAGRLMDASNTNLLCMDVLGDLVVAGGADHGLSVWNVRKGKKERTLFSKQCGHTEWVTSCAFTRTGRVLSGGMDSALWLWGRTGLHGDRLTHPSETHRAGISQVLVNHSDIALSASYDRTIKVWNVGDRPASNYLGTLAGHKSPVTHLLWNGGAVFSGDRNGQCMLWDLETMKAVVSVPTTGGQVAALGSIIDNETQLLFAGDQKGTLSGWDLRVDPERPVVQKRHHHPGAAVTAIVGTSMSSDNMLITAGADKVMHCYDPQKGFDEPLHTWKDHQDFIYAVETHANMVFSTGGNGWVLAHDVDSGKCCYGIGAGKNAMRCLATTDTQLVCAGDDGKIMAYDYV
jgi:WD40 repeat protein